MTEFYIRNILNIPFAFRLFQYILGGNRCWTKFATENVRAKDNDRILDIGCGTAKIIEYLPDVEYVGFDINQKYIDFARKCYGNKATLYCKKVSEETSNEFGSFNIVLATSILHHLNDYEAIQLFEIANKCLKSGGKLVTLDPCYVEGQSLISRYIISKDRGQYIRKKEEYLQLASKVFTDIKVDTRNDLSLMPYPTIIMECIP